MSKLIQVHVLRNYAPSNLNRNDVGAPKTSPFGDTLRLRVSSQALKRAWRTSEVFQVGIEDYLDIRTRLLPQMVREELQELGVDEKIIEAITIRLPEMAGGRPVKEGEELMTRQLILVSSQEVRPLSLQLLEIYEELGGKKWAKESIGKIEKRVDISPKSVSMAMFGRMTTSDAFQDVEASVQVAHAISTGAYAPQSDFFTAVDDLGRSSGAGMMGEIEFGSSTLYEYANIDWEALVDNLSGDTDVARQAVTNLIRAISLVSPSGKQNSFAAHNLPDMVMVEVNEEAIPVNYANAFLRAVRPSADMNLMDASVDALGNYVGEMDRVFGLPIQRAYVNTTAYEIPGEAIESLDELISWVVNRVEG